MNLTFKQSAFSKYARSAALLVWASLFISASASAFISTLYPVCTLNLTTSSNPVSCNGGADGNTVVLVSGGSGNYSYSWNSGTELDSASSGLSAGTYTVTVMDNSGGCTATATVSVTQPLAIGVSVTQTETCAGSANGTATANPSGGTGNYTYSWTSGSAGQTATGLEAGAYIVEVTDQNGCTKTAFVTIVADAALTVANTAANVSCFGLSNGSVSGTVSGGTGPYTYGWSNLGTDTNLTGIGPGTYSLTVTDSKGCTGTTSAVITQPPVLGISATAGNVLCNGNATGSISTNTSGGTNPYTYSWNGTTQTIANPGGLGAGNYTVTVTDAEGCTASSSVQITQPPLLTVSATSANVTCFGTSTGTASLTAGGGAGAYTYSWTPVGGNSANASGLPAGSYTATVSDANGCTRTVSVNITQPPLLTVSVAGTNLNCNAVPNGTASLSANGGTTAYTYLWSGGQTGPGISSLAAGTYSVTVTDARGCTASSAITITQPPPVIKGTAGNNVTCFGGNNGKAWVTPDGGKPPYVYAWKPSLSINDTIFGLTAGNYSLTVTDNSGCSESTVIAITQPTQLGGTTSFTNSSCSGTNDGTATLVPSGGTGAYTYSWNTVPAQTTATATGLGPGIFTIKLTDANGCEYYANVTISEAPPIFINTPVITKETCELSNGKISITTVGGTAPLTYDWAPSGGTTATASNLAAGTYTVTVTDSKGCTSTTAVAETNLYNPPVAIASTPSNVSCFGADNGAVAVTATAGTPAYSYNWSPGGGAGATESNLAPGTYSVTVTDVNGCTSASSSTITQPPAMVLNPSSANAGCGLANGSVSVAPAGGTLPYTYLWSNSATSAVSGGLNPGTFSVTVTDADGCTMTDALTVILSNPLSVTPTVTDNSCNGAANGKVVLNITGGSGGYSFNWAPSGGTTSVASGLAPGTYTVTVIDDSTPSCSAAATAVITQPAVLTAPLTTVGNTCSGSDNGSVTVNSTGGTSPYTYQWSNSGSSSSISGLSPGGYTVTVTDANGCTKTAAATVNPGSLVTANTSGTNIKCFGQTSGQAVVTAGGGTGPYTYNWSPSGGNAATAGGLGANTYTVSVTDAGGCTATSTVSLTQPPNLSLSMTGTNASCGSDNGTATVTPGGGLSPYVYAWTTSATTAAVSSLAPGTYTVVVNDANLCSQTATVVIAVSDPLSVTPVAANINCNGASSGSISIAASGGSGAYNYTWAPSGGAGPLASGLSAGTYSVTVSDAANAACSSSEIITITQPPPLNPNVTAVNITCNGSNDGTASSASLGGTPAYTYSWSTGTTSPSLSGLGVGGYTLTVTDANGCTGSSAVNITQGSALNVSVNAQKNVSCFGLTNGSASVSASGGTGTLTYSWSPGGGAAATASGLAANTYTVLIKDANGCSSTLSVSITQPAQLSFTQSATNASCGVSNGSSTVTPAGGTLPYTYNWSSGGVTSSESGLAPGSYVVTVTDANGCTVFQTVTIAVADPLSLTGSKTDLSCNGSGNGTASVVATGGTGSYNYNWAPAGGVSSSLSGLAAGTYTVTVSDAVNPGCTASVVINVTQPNPLTAAPTHTNLGCNGQNTGSVTAHVNGGTPAYTYNWTPGGGNGSNETGIPAGTYVVSVSDANGCTTTQSVTVLQPPPLTLTLDSVNVSCIGAYNGGIGARAGGGTPAYTYNWAPAGGPGDTIGGLGPGTYTLTVTDANGCTITKSITITEPPPFRIAVNGKNPTCYLDNGEAYVTITGGPPPFSVVWTPTGSTSDTITGLAPGLYQVKVTNTTSGCDTLGQINLAYPVVSLKTDSVNVSCFNFSNAKVWVNASGAAAPYSYSWSFSGAAQDTLSGLAPGTYTVTVHDQNGCVNTATASVSQPAALAATITGTALSCFNAANGAAQISVSGGSLPYSYTWSEKSSGSSAFTGQGSSAISGLNEGQYYVLVSDSNNCSLKDSVLLNLPTQILIRADSVSPSCNGGTDGSAFASVSGGAGAYTYSWMPGGGATSTAGNLSAGTYTLTVTDANGCTVSDSTHVINPTLLSLGTSLVNTDCGLATGKAYVHASGSNGSYTYQWAPVTGTADSLVNLSKGTYTVTVTDKKGCSAVDSVQISEPNPVALNSISRTNVLCNSAANGTATVVATGGSGTYVYSWSPGGYSSAAINGLSPSLYSVTVTDAANAACFVSDTIRITQPGLLVSTVNAVNINCFGNSNGTAGLVVSGGTNPYTYLWSNASTGNSLSDLSPATYSVTVTDANGCTSVSAAPITQPAAFVLKADSSDISCFGYGNGQVSISGSGGTGAYQFTWNPGLVLADTLKNLSPGTYTVNATDANGCSATRSISLTQPSGMNLTMNHTNTACGSDFGTAGVSVSGAVAPYTYLWSTGSSSAAISSLYKGTYFVTVTDNNGCTTKDSAKITEPNGIVITLTPQNISCNGLSNGSISASASGGSGSYRYSWTGGSTGSTISGLSPGTYYVKVTDAVNTFCSSMDSAVLTQPLALSAGISTRSLTCFGDSSGAIWISPVGGNEPYSYSWIPGSGTSDTLAHVAAGAYAVTVTDSKGCSISALGSVSQPSKISGTTGVKLASCGSSNGEAWATASGGTGSYTYSWSPVYSANDTIKGLLPGKEYVYITDANGCSTLDSASITLSNGITAAMSSVPVTCYGDVNGQASVTANGGSGVFTYNWAPGNNTNQSQVNLVPGMYTVTITDIHISGCILVDSVQVGQPEKVTVNLSVTKVACSGSNNYVVTAIPGGGTPGYFYTWSFAGTGQVESNLSPGTYIVEVTDTNGCDTAQIFSITPSSTPFIMPPVIQNPKCLLPNGSVSISIFGGVRPYAYAWSPSVSTDSVANNLSPGTYTVTVTDAFSCTDTRTLTLDNFALPPNVVATASPVSCPGGSNGMVTAVPNAGSLPYAYSWSPSGGTGITTSLVAAGTYTITVTDGQSCTATASATVTQPGPFSILVNRQNVSCFGGASGTASAFAGGGTPAYTYSWSTGSTVSSISNLAKGQYYFTLTDANSCTALDTVTITEPLLLQGQLHVVNNVFCNKGSNGSISVTPAGGTLPYTYSWSPVSVNDSTNANLPAGTYSLTITDNNGCTFDSSAVLTQPAAFAATVLQNNPRCFSDKNGSAYVTVSGATAPYIYSWQPMSNFTDSMTGQPAGSYTLNVFDSLGCTFSDTIVLVQPTQLNTSISQVNVSCAGAKTGSATAQASGGTPLYSYSWKTIAGSDSAAVKLAAGSYSVYVTDANGCLDSASATLTQPSPLTSTIAVSNLTCYQDSSGSANAIAGGGTGGYAYSWMPGNLTGGSVNYLLAGSYTLTITDLSGCSLADTVVITQPPAITDSMKIVNVLCFSKGTGSIQISAYGGNGGYSYSWNTGSSANLIPNLTSGVYTVTITDSKNCSIQDSAIVSQATQVAIASAGFPVGCYKSCNGQAVIIPSAGIKPYTVEWSTGSHNLSIDSLCIGTYSVQVTDANGCTNTTSIVITEPTALSLSGTSVTAHCNQNDGVLTVTASGATPPYSYLWKPGNDTASLIDSAYPGNYAVLVTDNNGCRDSLKLSVANAGGPKAAITSFSNVTCFGNCNGLASATASGGVGPYSYSWNTVPVQDTSAISDLCTGTYTVTVSDQFGCKDTARVKISSPSVLIVITSGDTNICIGQVAHLNAAATGGTPAYTFTWNNGLFTGANFSPNPTLTTTYTVIATDENGCPSNPVTITVHVKPPLDIQAQASPAGICPGSPAKLSVYASGGSGSYSFTWEPFNYTGDTITVAPEVTTTYTVVVNDGCTTPPDSALITVSVYSNPIVNFTANDTGACQNVCVSFTDKSTSPDGSAIQSWLWTFGDGKTSTQQNPSHCYDRVGKYTVSLRVTTSHGCTNVATKPDYITIEGLPVAGFVCNPNSVSVLAPFVNFQDKSSGAVTWKWNFGDGSEIDSMNYVQNPRHTYKDTGTYCVWQLVTNLYGCKDSAENCLVVYPQFTFYIPNAFTPNGDGLNDTFNGVGTYIKKYKMDIFDRWGNLIFETNSLSIGWDGRANYGSSVAQQDVYVWQVELTDVFDIYHTYIGDVTLLK